MDMIQKALYLASSVHKNQEGGLYFTNHILPCVDILTNEYFYYIAHYSEKSVEDIICAMILHDVIEDSNGKIDYDYLIKSFGAVTAAIVLFVTDGEGKNRKERKQVVYDRFAQFNRAFKREAALVKLIDRLANIRRGGKIDMYRKEHGDFESALYVPGEYEELWDEIESHFL
jgi:(p)ppGpp synthase/HD superfamily hydrolase